MNSSEEFNHWNPIEYLKAYFPQQGDSEPAVKFLIEEGKRIKGYPLAVDIGSGPTVCYWAAITPYVSGIILTDYLEINLKEQRKWIERQPGAYNWENYTKFILEYEGKTRITEADMEERDQVSRSKVSGYLRCDVTLPDPLGPMHRQRYDCVISFYCADSMTASKANWRAYMKNIFSLLRPGGFFIGAALRNCTHYRLEDINFPSANISEDDFIGLMNEYGFRPQDMRIEVANEGFPEDEQQKAYLKEEYNYDTVVMASGFLAT